ncbi:hypothetical protein Tco_0005775 [Tanacetum coccineum]
MASWMIFTTTNKGDAPAKPPQIITTNTLSNIKLPVLQKDDYDTWRWRYETLSEYIDNEEEQFADEKERKARTLLLMAVPKDHQIFHGMDDAKEISWARKIHQDNVWCSKTSYQQLDALGAGVSDEDGKSQVFAVPVLLQLPKTSSSFLTSDKATKAEDVDLIHEDLDEKLMTWIWNKWAILQGECKFKVLKRKVAGRKQVRATTDEELNHALMAFTVNNEVSMCSKLCLDSYNALQAKYDELQSEFGDQEAALTCPISKR